MSIHNDKGGKVRQISPGTDTSSLPLPSNTDYECWLLGSAITDPETMPRLVAALDSVDFSIEKHRRIFSRLKDLFERRVAIDRVSLSSELMRTGELESVDGLSYIAGLGAGLPPLVRLDSYISVIKEKSVLRKTMQLAQLITNQCYGESSTAEEILASCLERIQGLRGEAGVGSAIIESLPNVSDASEEESSYIVAPELPIGSVVAFTGESGCGKSTLLTALAREALKRGHPVLFLDRENPRKVIRDRIQRLGVPEGEMLKWWGCWVDIEPPMPGEFQIRSWVKTCEREPLVIVDNLSAFHGGDENEAGEMRVFMNQARTLAALGACVAILHNSGKSETSREYRGSSDFKAAVDQAFKVQNASSDSNLDIIRVQCYKSRYGFAGSVVYHYADGRFLRDERDDAPAISKSEQLTSLLRQNPGVSATKFETLSAPMDINRQTARDFLNSGVLGGLISREKGARKEFRYFLVSV